MTDAPPIVWEGSPQLRPFLVPIESVEPHPDNPRKGNVDAVAGSLARFGQRTPIVVAGAEGPPYIYKGNHTWRAARDVLGWTHIAILPGDDLPADELDAYLLADNRTSDLGEYEDEKLLSALERLADRGGLDGTGYLVDDVEDLRAKLNAIAEADAQPFGGGLSETPEELAAREKLRAEGKVMREIVLMVTEEQYERFGVQVKMLRKAYGLEGVVETVCRAVEEAAKAL